MFKKPIISILAAGLMLIAPIVLHASENRHISLDGKWRLDYWTQGEKPVMSPEQTGGVEMETIEATVPGNVEIDLCAAGLMPDPETGSNVYLFRAIEGYQWRYSREFTTPEYGPGDRVKMNFGGIDCFAEIYVNGRHVGLADNMLIPYSFDVTDALNPAGGTNTVEVYIKSSVLEGRKDIPPVFGINFAQVESVFVRRAPHTYGWDIMPRLVSAGLWKSVELEVTAPVHIRDAHWYTVTADPESRRASVFVDYTITLPVQFQNGELRSEITLTRGGKEIARQGAPITSHAARHMFFLENVDLWWPRGYGEPALYDATVRILDGDGNIVDCDTKKIGIRTVKLDFTPVHTEDNPGRFCFIVNGERIFARGSNWTPMDALHSRDPQHLEKTVALAVDLNCNMLRCWGGNVYEDDRFYELCDENGIMVWQDFAMGCTFYSQTERFTDAIEEEVSAVVMRLRSHPSIALWSGNNENDQTLTIGTLAPLRMDPNRDAVSRQVIPSVLYELDPTRTYLPSSPYWSEELCRSYYSTSALPEDHLWGPRGYYKDPFYTEANCLFVSEIGYHGMPCRESLEKMFPEESVYPWTDTGNFRWNEDYLTKSVRIFKEWGYTPDRNNLMINQVRLLFGEVPSDLDRFIFASQSVQAEAMKYFIEIYRGNKFAPKTGILWWNVRDGWPVISDAVTDYYFNKKLAYWFIRNVQKNVCLMVNDPVDGCYPLVAVNDTRVPASGKVSVKDIGSGEKIFEGEYTVGANSRGLVARLPQREGQGMLLITYTGPDGECRNHYLYGNAPFDLDWYGKMLRKTGIYEIK